MKKVYMIACAILLVLSATSMALEPVYYVEDGTGLVPDNEWTHEEVYTFLGGLGLEPGTYDLVFELQGTVWCEGGCTWGDAGDEIHVKALVNGVDIASTVRSDIYGSEVPFTIQLEIDFQADTTTNLSIYSWEFVTHPPTEKWRVGEATLTGTFDPYSELLPILDIKANGSDGPLTVSSNTPVSVTVSLNPGDYAGQNADWWVYAVTPFGWYSYIYPSGWRFGLIRTIATQLFGLSDRKVLNRTLPVGSYNIIFAVDDNANGILDATWEDSVEVTVE